MPHGHDVVQADPRRSWNYPGGDEDDDNIILFLTTSAGEQHRAWYLRLGITVDDQAGLQVETTIEER
jgi:hypothetical protein